MGEQPRELVQFGDLLLKQNTKIVLTERHPMRYSGRREQRYIIFKARYMEILLDQHRHYCYP